MSGSSKLVAVVAWIALALSGSAQGPTEAQIAEYLTVYAQGQAALQSGRHDEGIAAFERCLALVPKDSASAYNLACGFALKGDADQAFAWLDKAAEWGFGNRDGNIDHAGRQDPDLATLRSDPRFGEFVAKMTAQRKAIDDYVAKPGVYVPSALAGAREMPLLVVLHDQGATKEAVVAGPWKAVADALGMALLAPSGRYPTAGEPTLGMSWFESGEAYLDSPAQYEKSALDAVAAFQQEHKLDGKRVVIVGEGQGGALAASIAIGAPALYDGFLLVNAPFPEQLYASRAAAAGSQGLRARLVFEEGGAWLPVELEVGLLVDNARALLKDWGIAGDALTFRRGAPEALPALYAEHVRALLAAAPPTPVPDAKATGE